MEEDLKVLEWYIDCANYKNKFNYSELNSSLYKLGLLEFYDLILGSVNNVLEIGRVRAWLENLI